MSAKIHRDQTEPQAPLEGFRNRSRRRGRAAPRAGALETDRLDVVPACAVAFSMEPANPRDSRCLAPWIERGTRWRAPRLPLQRETATRAGRFGRPDEIAETAATALFLASDTASFFHGQVLGPNSGAHMG